MPILHPFLWGGGGEANSYPLSPTDFFHQNSNVEFSLPLSTLRYTFESPLSSKLSVIWPLKHRCPFIPNNNDLFHVVGKLCPSLPPSVLRFPKEEAGPGTLTARILCGSVMSSSWEGEHSAGRGGRVRGGMDSRTVNNRAGQEQVSRDGPQGGSPSKSSRVSHVGS